MALSLSHRSLDRDGVVRASRVPSEQLSGIEHDRGLPAALRVADLMLRDSFFAPYHLEIRSWVQVAEKRACERQADQLLLAMILTVLMIALVLGVLEWRAWL